MLPATTRTLIPFFKGTYAAPVYVAGDARNGSSLVVNAMADALACAAEVAEALEL